MVAVGAAHARAVLSVAVAPPIIISSSYDGAVKIWNHDQSSSSSLSSLQTLTAESDENGAVFSLAATRSTDDELLVCAGDYSRRIRVFSCSQSSSRTLWTSTQHTGWVRALAIGSSSRLYSIGCNRILGWSLDTHNDDDSRVWDSETAIFEDVEEVRSHDILCLAHSDPHELLAAGNVDGALRSWSTAGSVDGVEAPFEWRSKLTSGVVDGAARHWIGHDDRVASVAWRDDGSLLSAGYDGFVRAWKVDGTMIAERRVAAGDASGSGGRALALAVDDNRVYCGTSDGTLVTLEGDDLALHDDALLVDGGRVTAVATLAPGVVVVGDSEGALRVV